MKKKIYIAYTGGTIGMKRSPGGYQTVPGYLAEQLSHLAELKNPAMPDYYIHEYARLIDSSNISPSDWLTIANDIAHHYDEYDGIVVLHGTDTMAYTAAALSFMLEDLKKPVILTGGQLPLCELRNDSRENLISSLLIAANYAIPEVCLFFGHKLMRGNRTVKIDATSFDAFDSPNYPLLGKTGVKIVANWDVILPQGNKDAKLKIQVLSESRVAALRLFPGISEEVIANILEPPIKGLVLETYGIGNAPNLNPDLLDKMKKAIDRGVIIVNCTQCLKGSVSMDAYVTGSTLENIGVINGFDMTAEAALTKMFYLLSQKLPLDIIKEKMKTNLRGEITCPS